MYVLKSTMYQKHLGSKYSSEVDPERLKSALKILESRLGELLAVNNEGRVPIKSADRVRIAVESVRLGFSVDEVSRYLSWQEFEEIVEYALKEDRYLTLKNQHFKSGDNQCEVDVLGVSNNLILAIDCKRWQHGNTRMALKKAALSQLERVKMISKKENIRKIEERLDTRIKPQTHGLPVIVTLSEPPYLSISSIPIVPILKIAGFLKEIWGYLNMFTTVNIDGNINH